MTREAQTMTRNDPICMQCRRHQEEMPTGHSPIDDLRNAYCSRCGAKLTFSWMEGTFNHPANSCSAIDERSRGSKYGGTYTLDTYQTVSADIYHL